VFPVRRIGVLLSSNAMGRGRTRPATPTLFGLLALLSGCGEENTYVPPPPPVVSVSQPVRQTVTDYIEVTGNIQSSNSVDLVARVEGYLKSVDFTDGTFVKKGDLLFVIEPEPYQAQVQLNKATVEQEQATLTQANEEYARQQRLIKQNATSQSDLENWRAKQGTAQAAVEEANANLELAQINLGYTRITAPFDGRMGRHLVDPGNLVGAGSPTKLATIQQLAPIFVYFNVDESDVLRVRASMRAAGQTIASMGPVKLGVGLQNETGYPHEATLDFIDSDVDQSTGTLQLRGTIPNQDYTFLPGMFARVRIPVGTIPNALLVPDRALSIDQRGHYLLLVDQNDEVEQRPVQIGPRVGSRRVISQGLEAQDWVVVEGLQRAIPSDKVEPKKVTTPPPETSAPAATTSEGETGASPDAAQNASQSAPRDTGSAATPAGSTADDADSQGSSAPPADGAGKGGTDAGASADPANAPAASQ
jgi:multidrug efflux system membrane fusion protein